MHKLMFSLILNNNNLLNSEMRKFTSVKYLVIAHKYKSLNNNYIIDFN